MKTPRPRAAIFDLDGTLGDTFALVISAYQRACREFGGPELSPADIFARFGPPDSAMLRKDIAPPLQEKALARYRQLYADDHKKLATIFPGIPEMLTALKQKRIPLAIMTGKGRFTCDITLAKFGWTGTFAAVVTGDEVTHPKPAPEGPLLAARMLGVAAGDCIFVGDSPADILAGQGAGMTTLWASWHPLYEKEVRELKPNVVARSPADVVALFGGDGG